MPNNPRKSEIKINKVLDAWTTLRPEKSFAGKTLAEFQAVAKPSIDSRTKITALENQLIAAKTRRDEADTTTLAAIALIVNAVKGDPAEGDDGELYEGLGYTRKSERKSGLRRGKVLAAAAAK